jgi:2-dehydropantoate 2-reductase
MARYVVVGAGAVGGGLAALIVESGGEAVAVARGEHAEKIQRDGLTVRTPERVVTVAVPCVTSPDELRLSQDDVIVMTTKTHQLEAALRTWVDAPVIGGGTVGDTLPVITALNGVTSEDLALRYVDRVIGCCVWLPAVHLHPGEVILRGTPIRGTFHVAPVPAGRDESSVLEAVDRDWTAAAFRVVQPEDVMPWKYRKLVSNIGNAVQALVGAGGERPDAVVEAAEAEARAVLAAAGVEVTTDRVEAAERRGAGMRIAPVPGAPDEMGGSSWQSLARATGEIETDYLNGEIARLGRVHGRPAPINSGLARLARTAAATGQHPGWLSVAELEAQLGL